MTTNNRNMANRTIGLYIHLPFCQRKCSYCNFLSLENQSEQVIRQYIGSLLSESKLRFDDLHQNNNSSISNDFIVDTMYIGGGTPSLIHGADMMSLLDGIRDHWNLKDDAEITMESNPNSLTAENLHDYRKAGINRLSIGIQSFHDKLLSEIGRLHHSKSAIEAVAMAKSEGFNDINLDLMFGLPGQTLQEWKESLDIAISLEPTHLSLYTLQIEEGTKLYVDYKSEKLPMVDLDIDRACYHYAIDFLKRNGYSQYEISNFSKDGYACMHNTKYWSMADYLGLGLNASSYLDGIRWRNVSDLDLWTSLIQNGTLPLDLKTLQRDTMKDAISIFLFTGLRKTQGISLKEFTHLFGLDFFQAFAGNMKRLDHYRNLGLLDWSDPLTGRLWITETGIDQSNEIFTEFV